MSDEADIASDAIEMRRTVAIEQCRHRPGLLAKGSCWFCDEALPQGRKFCDRDCASDYEIEQAALARAGRDRGGERYTEH
jgi:hypothetical protein